MNIKSGRALPEVSSFVIREDIFRNEIEAHTLLALVNAEFQSDPHSTACFDLRIVERVRACVAKRDELKAKGVVP